MHNDVLKKPVYDKLVTKVSVIDTSQLILKTQYNIQKLSIKKKFDDTDKINIWCYSSEMNE